MGLLDRVFGGGARAKAEAVIAQQRGAIMDFVKAKYDAAQTNELNKNHWSMADYLSADAALNPMIRRKLNARARYERDNNGYLSGMAQRLAADMVGTGPRLFLDCGEDADEAAVEAVEQNFFDYCDSIDLASKLREIRSSYTVDGDPFGLFTTNGARRGVQLDFVTVEAEQVADPRTSYGLAEAEGVKRDRWQNVTHYHLLDHHPGSLLGYTNLSGSGRWIPAQFVAHWFNKRRAGQSRGIGEVVPVLETFASLRRFTNATLTAAEVAASLSLILKTNLPAENIAAQQGLWDTFPVVRGMSMSAPEGWDAMQLKAEHPTTTFSEFERRILTQIGCSIDMPYIVAVMDSSIANYSSMRGDRLIYQKRVGVDRAAAARIILDRLFTLWCDEAATVEGMIPDNLPMRDEWDWSWGWDGWEYVDPLKEATAEQVALSGNATTLQDVCSRRNKNWRKVLRQKSIEQKFAAELGIDLQRVAAAAAAHGVQIVSVLEQAEREENVKA
jgi:lambda family phage portal protein